MATIIVGTNSYVDVAFADAYFSDRYGFELWALLSEDDKNKVLISATQQLDLLCEWFSEKVDSEQSLEFPRVAYNPTPEDIKNAQCEIAYSIVQQGGVVTESEDPLTELKAGSVQLKWKASASGNPIINDTASSLVSKYGFCSGSGTTQIIPMERG